MLTFVSYIIFLTIFSVLAIGLFVGFQVIKLI